MPPADTRTRVTGAWLDDLATIAACWLDKHPVRRRLLLALIFILTGPTLVVTSSYAMIGLLLLLLPRFPRLRGRVAFGTGLLAALAGALRLMLTERTWSTFPQEDGLGLTLLALGILLGARRGPWLPWMTVGVLAGILLESPFGGAATLNVGPIGGTLLLILVARISAAPRTDSGTGAARTHFAVAMQRRPWLTSFMACMLAITMPTGVIGISPTLGVLLVALLFHATWRTPAIFDQASAWTAAMVVPAANVLEWVVGALILLLARDIARVTRIPDEHHLIADRTPVPRTSAGIR